MAPFMSSTCIHASLHLQFNTITELPMAYMWNSTMHRWLGFFAFNRTRAANQLYRQFVPLYIAYAIYVCFEYTITSPPSNSLAHNYCQILTVSL